MDVRDFENKIVLYYVIGSFDIVKEIFKVREYLFGEFWKMEMILGLFKGEKGRRLFRVWEGKINFLICLWG